MNRHTRRVTRLGLLLSLGVAFPLTAQDESRPPAAPGSVSGQAARSPDGPTPDFAAQSEPAVRILPEAELSDAALARWLVTEQQRKTEISRFAEQRSQNAQVKQFAAEVAQSHDELLQRLQPMTAVIPGAEAQIGQLDDALQGVGETLQDRLQQQARPADVSTAVQSEVMPPRENNDREGVSGRPEAREERRPVDRLRRDRPRGVGDRDPDDESELQRPLRQQLEARRAERQETADERQESREQRRQALRGILRDNLPEVLDVVGQALQAEAQQTVNSPWLQFHQQLMQQTSARVKEELGRYQGAEFDQAFLGYQTLADVEMIETFQLAKQHATEDLRPTLDEGIATAQRHLQQARKLMQQRAADSSNGERTRR